MKKLIYEYVRNFIELKSYRLLSGGYKGDHTKLEVQCPEGHTFEIMWTHFQQGHGCPTCWANSFSSKAEREIADMIEVRGIKIKRNDRMQIINPLTGNKLELDIWIPSLNKAIEFNGIYWHSFKDRIIKDKIKLEQCTKKNIELLIIKEQDWINNKIGCIDKIKTFIKSEPLLPHLETS